MQYGYGGYGWSGHNAKNDGYPKSYEEAKAYLAAANRGKGADSRKLPGAETSVQRREKYGYVGESYVKIGESYAVQYHATDIITWHSDGSFELSTGSRWCHWETPTTAIKMNACLPDGFRVSSFQGVLRIYGAKVAHILPDDVKLPRRREGERYPYADGYKATLTEEEWAADLTKRRERAAERARWQAEEEARRQQYIADGALPHVGQVWQRMPAKDAARPWERDSALVEESGTFATRYDAERWASDRARELAGPGYIGGWYGDYWTRTLFPAQAEQERAEREADRARQIAS